MLILALLFTLAVAGTQWTQLQDYHFGHYTKEFNRKYHSNAEFNMRKGLFDARLKAIKAHNQDPTKTWKMGVNQFTDDVDWRDEGVITAVKDQGRCGSCWSFAAAETLESYYALQSGNLVTLSEQQILDCTPNPNHCGGTGGCGGATVELAYQQLAVMGGLASEWTYPYNSYYGELFQCNTTRAVAVAKVASYVNLPQNEYDPIVQHLSVNGPLAVSVDASTWFLYESGVYNGCNQTNPDLDHAVQLVGMGTDQTLGDYWLIRNSWTPSWGEAGYIRLAKSSTVQCGVDITPQDGDGCTGGPPTEKVCGTCGVLYDAVYPVVKA